ncbi:MAG: hypothetical protein RLY13_835 [Actinomycetota bacterium]|jgi:hypothetical protein
MIATWISIVTLAFVSLFQLALVLGAPIGEYAFGGAHKGKLPVPYRIGSAVSILIYLATAGHYLAQAGVLDNLLPEHLNNLVNWLLVGLNAMSLVMNGISRSKKERNTWVPVALLLLICSIFIALNAG